MIICVKYFGAIAEKAGCNEEKIVLTEPISLSEFSDFIKEKYQLVEVPFKVAVNQKFDENSTFLNDLDEVALLPPFAGG